MPWHLSEDPDEFWSAAGGFLQRRPVQNTVPLTLTDTLRNRNLHFYGPDDPIFGWFTQDGEVTGACLQTPPHPLLLIDTPLDSLASLAALLAGRPLPAVSGRTEQVEAYAAAWPAPAKVGLRTRLFQLGTLTPPSPPGQARVAGPADRELVIAWLNAFHDELGEPLHHADRTADDKISFGGIMVWEVDGRPVSLAGRTRAEGGVIRVAPVYTPVEQRGRGYGGAVTSAVSQQALELADQVVLYTDLANPTSNALYQRLGYRPIEDRTVLEFT